MDCKLNINNNLNVRSDMDCLCLICCSTSSNPICNSYHNDNLLFKQEQVIFILKHLLHLPRSQLEEYLQAYGSPDQWFNLCDECIQLTDKARELHLQLLKIEKELKDIQRKILDTVKSDSTTEPSDHHHYQHESLNSKLLIWRETRLFVKNESYQNLYLDIKEEPHFEEPETSTPFPPPDDHNNQVKEEFDDPDPEDISNNYDEDDSYLPSPSSSSPSPPHSPASKKDNLLTCDICGKTAFSSRTSLSTHRIRFHKAWKIGPHKKRRKTPYPNDNPQKWRNDKLKKPPIEKPKKSPIEKPKRSRSQIDKPEECRNDKPEEFPNDNPEKFPIDKPEECPNDNPEKSPIDKPEECPNDKPEKSRIDKPEECPNDDTVTQSAPKPDPTPSQSQRFPCPSCSLTFRFGSKWQYHLLTVHKSEELPCFIENCNRKFYRLKPFLSHLTVHLTGIEFVCPHCPGKLFPDRGTLNRHIKLKHNPDGPPPTPDISQLTCEICGSSKFSSTTALATHKYRVHKFWKRGPKRKYGKGKFPLAPQEVPPEKHLCDLCGSSFNSKARLQYHVKLSHEKCFPCYCHLCGRGSTCQNELKIHMIRWHKEEAEKDGLEMYTCRIEGCTRYYISREQYDKHLREEHGGGDNEKDKPFKCEECDKSFFWKGRLALHEMTHKNKGLKCYQCKICDKGYSIPRYLKRHLREKHGIKSKKGTGTGEIL